MKRNAKAVIGGLLYVVIVIVAIFFGVLEGVAYYTWSCEKIKTSIVTRYGHAPARCIK